MRCAKFNEIFDVLSDGGREEARLREHAQDCAACKGHLEEAERVLAGFSFGEDAEPSDGFHARIMAEVQEASWWMPSTWFALLRRSFVPALAGAAAMACLFLMARPTPTVVATSAAVKGSTSAGVAPAALSTGRLVCLWGRVEHQSETEETAREVSHEVSLAMASRIGVGEGAEALVLYEGGHSVRLAGPASYVLIEGGGRLESGRGRFTVVPNDKGFRVQTPHEQIVVLGTRFEVAVGDDGHAEVDVDAGHVLVENDTGSKALLKAGQRYRWCTSAPASAPCPVVVKPMPTDTNLTSTERVPSGNGVVESTPRRQPRTVKEGF